MWNIIFEKITHNIFDQKYIILSDKWYHFKANKKY